MRSTSFFRTPPLTKLLFFFVATIATLSAHCTGQTVMLSFGTLTIDGTMDDDRAVVRNGTRNRVVVRLNRTVYYFDAADIDRIQFFGRSGDDDFINNTGIRAFAYGGPGADYLVASTGVAEYYGDSGDDTLVGGTQRDFLYGNADDDLIYGNGGNDVIYGDLQFRDEPTTVGEQFISFDNEEECEFEDGDDLIFSGAGDDRVFGNGGNDRIYAGSGNDFVNCGDGADRVFGSSGDDCLEGDNGDDFLNGGSGNDNLAGGFNNDRLFGMSGDDNLFGGNGVDQLNGGSGNNTEIQNGPNFCDEGEPEEEIPLTP